jgi:hypothetical protein
MNIYLRHPVHGLKIAISNVEAAMDHEHGWEEYDPLEPAARQAELAASPDSVVTGNELRVRRKRKE